jgi:hypothetical protein
MSAARPPLDGLKSCHIAQLLISVTFCHVLRGSSLGGLIDATEAAQLIDSWAVLRGDQ